MIDNNGIEFPPCAWCGMDEMDEYASFNGGDICVDCETEATSPTQTTGANNE